MLTNLHLSIALLFQIWLLGNESKQDLETTVNASTTHVNIRNVAHDMNYKLQVAAFNRAGDGIRSDPISVGRSTGGWVGGWTSGQEVE